MLANELETLFDSILQGMGYELLLVEIKGSGADSLLRVYIDSPNGIGLEDCEAVSHELSAALDVADVMAEAYRLEVSSPGLDRPLVKAHHFERFTGYEAKLQMRLPVEGRKRFRGEIIGVQEDMLHLKVDGSEVALPIENIDRARLVPDYDALENR
ncbi:MAG: ribosome maturation factor RimP [Nevskiales bacterium]